MNVKTIVAWVLSVLLALAFFGAGMAKFTSQPMMVTEFHTFGYPLWFMFFTAALEVLGAVLVLIPKYAFYGATLLAVVMVGAVVTLVTHGMAGMVVPPIVLLILAGLLANVRKPGALVAAKS